MKNNKKNFEQLSFDVHESPMNVKEEKLENTITKWQADHAQTNDILFMELRI